jgi:predicted phosphodiesterase
MLIGKFFSSSCNSCRSIIVIRYLAKTFTQANAYVKPDWILFLGDIFDEGLSATDNEFERYFERFNSIFNYKNYEQQCIIIPGDNDVGGEYYGDKQTILRERFQNYFGRIIALYYQNDIQFLKVLIFLPVVIY